jgi:molybdopterin synthase catalytic subunit
MRFQISSAVIAPERLKLNLAQARAGACVAFEGWVRDHNEGRSVIALEYEAYPLLAEKEGVCILAEALEKFGFVDALAFHRVGRLAIGELAVWVGVSAEHRDAAFGACRYLIDEIKARVPIWKKEHYADGVSEWINCATRGDRGAEPAP